MAPAIRSSSEMEDSYKKEVGSNGVNKFWEEVEEHIKNKGKT